MSRSATLERELQAVQDFLDGLRRLLQLGARRARGAMVFEWVALDGKEAEFDEQRQRVNRLAGPAAAVVERVGRQLVVQPPPITGQPARALNPIESWYIALDPPNLLTVEDVLDFAEGIAGRVEAELAGQHDRERSLAGRVARVVGFPVEVREVIRQSGSPIPPAAGFWGALVVEVIVGVIAAGLLWVLAAAVSAAT